MRPARLATVVAFVLVGAAAGAHPLGASAQDGPYVGAEVNAAFSPALGVDGFGNAWNTLCRRGSGRTPCDGTGSPGARGRDDVGAGMGTVVGLVAGYRFGRLRVEGEYFHRTAAYGGGTSGVPGGGVTRIGLERELDASAHNAFANVHWELGRSASRYTPYVGLGAGLAFVSTAYELEAEWPRDVGVRERRWGDDDGYELEFAESELRFGYQAMAGLDYAPWDRTTLGVKVRWMGLAGSGSGASSPTHPVNAGGFPSFSVGIGARFRFD